MSFNYDMLFCLQPLSVRGWTSAFPLDVHRLCSAIEGRLSHFPPRWLRTAWQSVNSEGEIPRNTLPRLEIEPKPQGGQTVRYICSPTDLSRLTCNRSKICILDRSRHPLSLLSPLKCRSYRSCFLRLFSTLGQ